MVPCDVQEQCLVMACQVLLNVFGVFIAEPHRLREYLLLRWSPDDVSATASKNVKQSTEGGVCLGIYSMLHCTNFKYPHNMPLLPLLNIPKFLCFFPEPVKSICSHPKEDIEVSFVHAVAAPPLSMIMVLLQHELMSGLCFSSACRYIH